MMVSVNFWKEFFFGNLYEKELKVIIEELKTDFASSPNKETFLFYKHLAAPKYVLGPFRSAEYEGNFIRSWFFGTTYDNWVNLVFAFGVSLFTLVAAVLVLNWNLSPSLRLKHS